MQFNEFTVLFLVVTIFGFMNAETTEIPSRHKQRTSLLRKYEQPHPRDGGGPDTSYKMSPVCEPPALRCSVFKRSVCEWSDSGEPVWACRGYFETVKNEPRRPKEKQQEPESDLILGTYEYQIPQGSKKLVSHQDSDSDVQFVTYTYPIATQNKKSAASPVEPKSDVKFGTYALPIPSGNAALKEKPGSELKIGTYTLPSDSTSIETGESDANAQLSTYTYQVPSNEQNFDSGGETGSNVLTSGKSSDVTHDDSHPTGRIETFTYQIPVNVKSPVAKVDSDSTKQLGTYALPTPRMVGSRRGEEANHESGVQVETHKIPSSKTKSQVASPGKSRLVTSKQAESDSHAHIGSITLPVTGARIGEEARDKFGSASHLGTYQIPTSKNSLHQVPSNTKPVGSNAEPTSGVRFGTYAHGSSSKSESSSHVDPEANLQLGTYQLASDKSADSAGSDIKADAATSITSASKKGDSKSLTTGVYAYESSASSSSQSGDQIGSDAGVNQEASTPSAKSSKSMSNTDSAAQMAVGTTIHTITGDTTHGGSQSESGVLATGAVQTNQPSAIQGAHSLTETSDVSSQSGSSNGFQAGSEQGHTYSGVGVNTASNGVKDGNWAIYHQQHPRYSTAYSQAGQYIQAGHVYSESGSDVSQQHQVTNMGSIVSPYLNSGNAASSDHHWQHYQGGDSAAGTGSFHQKYGTQSQATAGNHNGYSGYKSLEHGISTSSSQLANSGNGMYHWPQPWSPLINAGTTYGTHWLVGHGAPLVTSALNGVVAPHQNMIPFANSGYYGSQALSSNPDSSRIANAYPRSSPWLYSIPVSQYAISRTLGTPNTYPSCYFCKGLMSFFGGATACDVLEPIIIEFVNKIFEVFHKRLK